MSFFSELILVLQSIVWGPHIIVLILAVGIYITLKTRFFQISRMGHILKSTIFSAFGKKGKGDNSPFRAACTALAATIGTGNIAGVATAITLGGPGAVFWMWISAIFGMMTAFAENILGGYYRKISPEGELLGGGMYYLKKGLKGHKILSPLAGPLSVCFGVFCLLASLGMGNMTQSNTAANVLNLGDAGSIVFGAMLAVFIGIIMLGGTKRVGQITEKLVPFMALFYILGTILVIALNFDMLPEVFAAIFKSAFGIKPAVGGFSGAALARALGVGVKRGVFSNEAGLGSAVIVNSASSEAEPAVLGMWGIFEVFFDTVVVCTLTALAVLSTGLIDLDSGAALNGKNGAALVSSAFSASLGDFAGLFIAFSTLFFAVSTIIGWSFFGIKSAEFLFSKRGVKYYKILFTLGTFLGAVISLERVWQISDIFNGLMAIPNLIGIIALRDKVPAILQNYKKRHFNKKIYIVPILAENPELNDILEARL